jgi:short-subunit dehydrogenase
MANWKWVMGVNLWGVIHGVRVFVPIMLEQDSECHIVNTASMAGLISGPQIGIYKVTKHGVVSLSETLYHELALIGAKINVSVLCPGSVNTRIMDADRNRPPELQNDPAEEERIMMRPEYQAVEQFIRQDLQAGMSRQQVADCVFNAIREAKFYIITHPDWKPAVQLRMEDILQERSPTDPSAFLFQR